MYVDEPQKDGNIPDFNISKIDICPFRAYQRNFRLFHGYFSKDVHQRSRLLCFTQNDHTGHAGFKICPFFKVGSVKYILWLHLLTFIKVVAGNGYAFRRYHMVQSIYFISEAGEHAAF